MSVVVSCLIFSSVSCFWLAMTVFTSGIGTRSNTTLTQCCLKPTAFPSSSRNHSYQACVSHIRSATLCTVLCLYSITSSESPMNRRQHIKHIILNCSGGDISAEDVALIRSLIFHRDFAQIVVRVVFHHCVDVWLNRQ